jgi:hypothetical protein
MGGFGTAWGLRCNIDEVTMPIAPTLCGNGLLAALDPENLASLVPHLNAVDLPLGCVLCEPSCNIAHVFFPNTAIASLRYVLENGSSREIAVVGREGVARILIFMGGDTTPPPRLAVVQSAGQGYRVLAEN